MEIYLVRHGESEANADKSLHLTQADHAIHLSEKGKEQAKKAGRFLSRYLEGAKGYTRLWVSPYMRTRETADLIHQQMGDLITDRKENIHLVEQQFGLFDGLEGDDIELQKRFPQEFAHYKKCEDQEGKFWARMPLGESRFDVALRVHQCFGTFHRDKEKYGIKRIIVVAHGLSNRAFLMQWLHLPVEWFEKSHNPLNCSVTLIDGQDYRCIYKGG